MFADKKMHALEELVASDYPIAIRRTNYGGVMTDAKAKYTAWGRRNPSAYAFNQIVFENSQR
jgi:hypothetical protein